MKMGEPRDWRLVNTLCVAEREMCTTQKGQHLALPVPLPVVHYREANHKWFPEVDDMFLAQSGI